MTCLHSLLQWSCMSLAQHRTALDKAITWGLPNRLYQELLLAALNAQSWCVKKSRDGVMFIVARWPYEELEVKEFIHKTCLSPDQRALAVFHVMEGLLCLQACSRLQLVSFMGLNCSKIFQLPILSISPEERCSARVLNKIGDTCKSIQLEGGEDFDSVLSWRMTQLSQSGVTYKMQKKGKLHVRLECNLNLSDWVSVDDEILGLILQDLSPFTFQVGKVAVYNFKLTQVPCLRWIMSILDPLMIEEVGIYGARRSVYQAFWKFADVLQPLTNIKIFGMAASGPKLLRPSFSELPSDEELNLYTSAVLHCWTNLQDILLNRVTLTNQLGIILESLPTPLRTIFCYANSLTYKDIRCLASCHHVPHLRSLTLEKNDLQDAVDHVIKTVARAASLGLLNLRDCELRPDDKVSITSELTISGCKLSSLLLVESEDMCPPETYEVLVAIACNIPTLQYLYIFPFTYGPFDAIYRKDVQLACQQVLEKNNRTDLMLLY